MSSASATANKLMHQTVSVAPACSSLLYFILVLESCRYLKLQVLPSHIERSVSFLTLLYWSYVCIFELCRCGIIQQVLPSASSTLLSLMVSVVHAYLIFFFCTLLLFFQVL